MRIISGKYRGKKLKAPKDDSIRPTSDRIKENIFNILMEDVSSAVVIDAFSGTGSLGIECLSRGAKKVYFIDKEKKSIDLIKENLKDIEGDYLILNQNALTAFEGLKEKKVQADLIFIDPPYNKDNLYVKSIQLIVDNNLLSKDGKIILEKSKDNNKDYSFKGLRVYREKKYGETIICFMQNVKKIALTGTFDPITLGHIHLIEEALKISPQVNVVMLKNAEKQEFFPEDIRLQLINKSTERFGDRVVVDNYKGLAIDYCNQNDVQLIVRGIRDEKDLEYENRMAKWNKENGSIDTLIIKGKENHISSTKVRERLRDNLSVKGFAPDEIREILEKKIYVKD